MHSVFWEEDENTVLFKLPLASGTKQEGVKVTIEDQKLFVSEEAGSSINQYFGMYVTLPEGLNPDSFETSVDQTGLLTVRFKKRMLSCSTVKSSCDMAPMGWFEPDDKNGVIHFKVGLSAETKKEDLVVGVVDRQFLIIGQQRNEKKEGGSCASFVVPHGVNPEGFETSMDEPGVLTVTFKKKPSKDGKKKNKKKFKSRLLGGLAEACLLTACKCACDELTGDDS